MSGTNTDVGRFSRWLFSCGGAATMISYGLQISDDLEVVSGRFRSSFPDHLRILAEALPIVVDDEVAYVHAGIDPERPLHAQRPRDLMMIRDGFLDWSGPLPRLIVHGHTPCRMPEVHRQRIALDTGAYASGVLSCLLVEEGAATRILLSSSVGGKTAVYVRAAEEFQVDRLIEPA